VTFAYKDVLEDHVPLDQLDTFLSSSSFKENLNVVRSALVSSNIFVITSTIKSQSITVKTQGEDSPSGGIEVPVIQNIASGKLSVDVTRANQGEITFSGSKPVVFGFKAVQVFTDENARYRIFKPVRSGSVELEGVAEIKYEDMAFLDLGAVEVIEEERTAAQGMGSSR